MEPRVVMVRRRTEYESLLREHGTPQMAAYRLEQRGLDIGVVAERHRAVMDAAEHVLGSVPTTWRKTWTLRGDLDRFRFDPEDLVVGVGLDGLVPNVAKYLNGQRVVGVNPTDWPQQMMHFRPQDIVGVYASLEESAVERRSMVEVTTDDGRELIALNELFCGHRTHQSAKYDIEHRGRTEYQSSSGLIVTTGTGATGWASSIANATKIEAESLPRPADPTAFFLIREAWASAFTGTDLRFGEVTRSTDGCLRVTSKMQEDGVIFGDGIESDRLAFSWGQTATFRVAERTLNLVIPTPT